MADYENGFLLGNTLLKFLVDPEPYK